MRHHWIGSASELVLNSKYYSIPSRNPTKKSQQKSQVMDLTVTTKPEARRFFTGPQISIPQHLHQSLPPQHDIPASYFQAKNPIPPPQDLQTEYGTEMVSGSPDLYLRIIPLLALQRSELRISILRFLVRQLNVFVMQKQSTQIAQILLCISEMRLFVAIFNFRIV
jgi:hypothetical protein